MSAFQELVKQGIMKTRVEFRAVKKDTEYVILGIIAFEADENNEITKIFGAFDAYFEDEIEKEIQRSFIISDGLTGIQLQKKFAKEVDNYLTLNPDSQNALIFIDIDDEIVKREQKSIAEIFVKILYILIFVKILDI